MRPSSRHACLTALLLAALGLFAPGCAVRSVYVKPDFEQKDKNEVKRLAVGATPIPGQQEKAAELLARMARRHINMHKDYLATEEQVLKDPAGWRDLCGEEIHGVVRVMVARLLSEGGDLTVDMTADLQRCDSSALVWKVEIDDTNEQKNEDLKELAGVYRREFGEVADALAAPFFVLLKTAFDSLPSPVLTDEETMEKIELE